MTGRLTWRARGASWRPAYWADADRAEFDCLTWALVCGLADHYPRCARCQEHVRCPAAVAAIESVADWLTARRLQSRAEREALQSNLYFRRLLRRLESDAA